MVSPHRPRRDREARELLDAVEDALRRRAEGERDVVATVERARAAAIPWRDLGRRAARVHGGSATQWRERLRKLVSRSRSKRREGSEGRSDG